MGKEEDEARRDEQSGAPPAPVRREIEAAARQRFAELAKPEISSEDFVEREWQEAQRVHRLAAGEDRVYQPAPGRMTVCGNGDLETGLDPSEWQGAWGLRNSTANPIPFGSLTEGIQGGAIDAAPGPLSPGTAHQTWVSAGTDPNVGIPLTAQGSKGAVRIGNAVPRCGCELLSKTFVVTAARKVIRFWYAIVMEDPKHKPHEQPFFWVRVTDTNTGALLPGAVDLGNGTDRAVADATNPFFRVKGNSIVYKDWSCAQINLGNHVGKMATVEFITADCSQSGHWAYAYIDAFCGDCAGSPEGDLTFNAAASSGCGPGRLCFEYSLPKAPAHPAQGAQSGSIRITLEILQNGATVTKFMSPVLTDGTRYCFDIDPANITGLDPALGGFDFVATGDFRIGATTLAPLTVGDAPEGMRQGRNNDYLIACPSFRYAVKFVCGRHDACCCDCGPVQPGRYSTEINILNAGQKDAEIVQHVFPVVLAGAPAGRQPRSVRARAADKVSLPAASATMIDCCRLAELLLGAPASGDGPVTIGYLEIVSSVELEVTAVHTATGPDGGPVSLEVERIDARRGGGTSAPAGAESSGGAAGEGGGGAAPGGGGAAPGDGGERPADAPRDISVPTLTPFPRP